MSAANLHQMVDMKYASRYDGRILFILKRILEKDEFEAIMLLIATGKGKDLEQIYGDRIQVNLVPASKRPEDNFLVLDDTKYLLTVDHQTFVDQFERKRNFKASMLHDKTPGYERN